MIQYFSLTINQPYKPAQAAYRPIEQAEDTKRCHANGQKSVDMDENTYRLVSYKFITTSR